MDKLIGLSGTYADDIILTGDCSKMGSPSLFSSPPLDDYGRSADMGVTGLPDGVALGRVPTSGEDPARCARFGIFPRHVTYLNVVFAFPLLPLLGAMSRYP
jgi:hypothetical protein